MSASLYFNTGREIRIYFDVAEIICFIRYLLTLRSVFLCERNVRVGTNSPNLCPIN